MTSPPTFKHYLSLIFSLSHFPGNFTFPGMQQCTHCSEGYFIQHLVRNRGWSYSRLALDGLRSIVFDSTSPTYCIASGNIWYDHGCSNKAGCVTHATARDLYALEGAQKQNTHDWQRFYSGDQICLRLSEKGFDNGRKC